MATLELQIVQQPTQEDLYAAYNLGIMEGAARDAQREQDALKIVLRVREAAQKEEDRLIALVCKERDRRWAWMLTTIMLAAANILTILVAWNAS